MTDDVPDFILPETIASMSNVQLFAFVEELKHRRLESRRQFEVLQRAKEMKQHEFLQAALDKLYVRMAKQIATTEKNLDKLEELANKVAGMRLQGVDEDEGS